MPTEETEIQISIDLIDEPEWNSRIVVASDEPVTSDTPEGGSIKSLAATLVSEGQINAITVEGPTESGRYIRITGSRRVAAARLNGWKTIRARVRPISDEASRILENAIENIQRRDLTLYEQARACAKLRELGISGKESAAKLGFSVQKVSNLVQMFTRLPQQITWAWSKKEPAATFDFLRDLASIATAKENVGKEPDEITAMQLDQWKARIELMSAYQKNLDPDSDPDPDPDPDPDKKTPPKPYTVSQKRYTAIISAVKDKSAPGTTYVLEALKALVGKSNAIKGVWKED